MDSCTVVAGNRFEDYTHSEIQEEILVGKKLGFGIVGLGEIAFKSTGKFFQETKHARLVAGVDPLDEMARSYEETYGIPCSTQLDDVLNHSDVDAVIVSTPHDLHAPIGIKAAEAGKHVIVEKPMATTLEDADALIFACRKNGVLCSAKEAGVRYQAPTIKAKELIDDGVIGEIMAVQIAGMSNKPVSYWTGGYSQRVQTTWRMSKSQSGGGVLLMNYIYDIHRMLYVTGLEVKRVFSEYDTFRTDAEVEDFITVAMRFNNGALGTITSASCVPGARVSGVRGTESSGNRIFGSSGQLVFQRNELLVFTEKSIDGLSKGEWTTLSFKSERMQPYVDYVDRFALAAMNNRPADVPGEDGRRTLEVLVGAYESGESGQPVLFPM